MSIITVEIDLAKNVLAVCGAGNCRESVQELGRICKTHQKLFEC